MSTAIKLRVLEREPEEKTLPELAGEAAEYWEENLDVELREFHIRDLISWYKVGFEHELILAAMKDTMQAPTPSWRYFTAIMTACHKEKALTFEAWRGRMDKHDSKKMEKKKSGGAAERVKRVSAQMYQQREYTEEQLIGNGISDRIKEAQKYDREEAERTAAALMKEAEKYRK